MELASSLFELVKGLGGFASKPLGYVCNLKDNVRSLRNETDKLKAKRKDMLARVELQEGGGGARRTEEVACWLDTMQKFLDQVDQVLQEAEERDRIKCLGRCLPPNCRSSYKLGKRVDEMLNYTRENQPKDGEFGIVTLPLPPPPVLEMPTDKIVGLDISHLNEVWKWVMEEKQVGVIGLYGIGGVGKTTLMNRINEKLSRANHGFEVVIWVLVSRQVNEDSIRDIIRKRLHIQDERWHQWSRDEKVHHLWEVLTQKKFVLLIDDVWKRLELSKIGVPLPGLKNGSKVIFTTRSKQVCDQMGADKTFEVQCLMPKEALELFENNAGESIVHSDPEITELAKDIAGECKGLPLALITVGRAMAGRKNPHEWKHALTTLRNNPHKLSGMVEEVYHILEFSYDSLNDSTIQRCFLYCCLFPEDYSIRPRDLIELWIGEGFLGDNDDVYSLRDKGEYVLGSLKLACLLERGPDDYEGETVKMHDVIRDMATWIARDRGQRENKLLVIEKEEDLSAEMISKWREAEKVSLWGTQIENIDRTPSGCSRLETLFVRETKVKLLPRGFFYSMTASLTVLNLSDNRHMKLFPKEICYLINLRYLNLSNTRIGELPMEIKKLTHLRWLLLDDTPVPFLFPTGAIASLPLNVFSQWTMSSRDSGLVNEEETVEEFGGMQHLTCLSIEVFKSCSALKIFQSPSLKRSIRRARITDCAGLTRIPISYSPTGSGGFLHFEELCLVGCAMLREIEITQGQGVGRAPNSSCFPNLVAVTVSKCGLPDLSWLVHVPKLRNLKVEGCDSMQKITGDGCAPEDSAASGLFSHLASLYIGRLPNLTSICDQTLPFPRLGSLVIVECPRLRKLPVDSNSARGSLESVRAGADWWAKLVWKDDAAQAYFTGKLRPLPIVKTLERMKRIHVTDVAHGLIK